MANERLIGGVHHTALRPTRANYDRTLRFYTQVLGFSKRLDLQLAGPDGPVPGAMLDAGDGTLVEIFGNGDSDAPILGTIKHICYRTADVDGLMARLQQAGYPPCDPGGRPRAEACADVTLSSDPPYGLRVGFIQGPCGELLEFAQEI